VCEINSFIHTGEDAQATSLAKTEHSSAHATDMTKYYNGRTDKGKGKGAVPQWGVGEVLISQTLAVEPVGG